MKRNLFEELQQGIEEIKAHESGKITLRQYKGGDYRVPEVTPELIRDTRERLNMSRTVFAYKLHMSPRTLEKWEQGTGRPNDQAATLIMLLRKYPDTLQRLEKIMC